MNLLADEGMERQIVASLRQAGHTVLYIAELAPGISDRACRQSPGIFKLIFPVGLFRLPLEFHMTIIPVAPINQFAQFAVLIVNVAFTGCRLDAPSAQANNAAVQPWWICHPPYVTS